MKTSPFAQYLRRQQGATLIVMVLLTAMMLLAVLFITTNLTLGTRNTTNDHRQTIPAQFAAESGMALAKATFDSKDILTSFTSGLQQSALENRYMIVDGRPKDTSDTEFQKIVGKKKLADVNSMIQSLCGRSADLNPTMGTWKKYGAVFEESGEVCDFKKEGIDALSGDRLTLFQTLLSPQLPKVKTELNKYGLSASDNDRDKYLEQIFNDMVSHDIYSGSNGKGTKIASYDLQGGFKPIALLKREPMTFAGTGLSSQRYTLLFEVGDFISTGRSGTSQRRMIMNNRSDIFAIDMEFFFFGVKDKEKDKIDRSFTNFGLFIDDARGAYFTSSDSILGGGRAHTNTYWHVAYNQPGFKVQAELTSSGCEKMTIDSTGKHICTNAGRMQGIQTTRGFKTADKYKALKKYIPKDPNYIFYGDARDPNNRFLVNKDYKLNEDNFKSEYIAMPSNAQSQIDLAQKGGIVVGKTYNVRRLKLSVIQDSKRGKLQCMEFNLAANNGNRTTETQVICHDTPDKGKNAQTNVYEGNVQVYIGKSINSLSPASSGNGPLGWKADNNATRTSFNGVIYTDNPIASLTGPERPKGAKDSTGTGAAIADFANITITAQSKATPGTPAKSNPAVVITGDLRNEEIFDRDKGIDNRSKSSGVLGIFAPVGMVKVANPGNRNAQQTNPDSSAPLNVPDNPRIDSFIMSSQGTMDFDRSILDGTLRRGRFEIYGGTIFSTFFATENGATTTGFGLNNQYDARKIAPNGFPTYEGPKKTTVVEIVPDANPSLVGVNAGYLDKTSGTKPTFNAGEIRQVAIR